MPAIGLAQQIAIGEYPLPTFDALPEGITAGPDGALWFTEYNSGKIGRIAVAGTMTEYGGGGSGPQSITAGPDGALWFTEYLTNAIGRITTAGAATGYALPSANAGPAGIAAGSDSALWFTESKYPRIGRITTSGQITEYVVGLEGYPQGITAGPDGALWFTVPTGGKIGRITTSGQLTAYPVPTAKSQPYAITSGPDGALWFTESVGNIGRITTVGAITEYAIPSPNSAPWGITTGSDGALWFTETNHGQGSKIGRITTAGAITEFAVPTAGSGPWGITSGPDGELWFAEYLGNRIGEALFVTAALNASPASGLYQTNLTFSGSAFAANERVQVYSSGVGSAVLASGTADSSGSFNASGHAPMSPYGPRLFLAAGQSSGKIGAASFSMNPNLVLSPASGPVGSTAKVLVYGFGSFEQVNVYWNSPRVFLGTVTANVAGTCSGSAALTVTVPNGAPTGRNGVIGIGSTTNAKGYGFFTVQ